jgi:hypothetical protein
LRRKINLILKENTRMAQTNANAIHLDPSTPREGTLTKMTERQTAKIPSMGFLALAIGAMAVSAGLEVFTKRRRDPANFVGLWVPTLLLFGIYNKLVKIGGSDQAESNPHPYTH